ncbi:MAG: YggT family protein [Chloroflexi bacterium]|nr:YggT family protein [Chloroflexota bacterium]
MILIYYALVIFQFILLARVLMSWFPNIDHNNQIVRLIYDITEPVLRPIRNALPQTGMAIDFSPLIVFLIISVLTQFLFQF